MELTKGAVVLVELMGQGDLIRGVRPAVVVSNSVGNKASRIAIVSPLTSKSKKPLPTHTEITPTKWNGLTKKSTLITEQITAINKSSIIKVLGNLNSSEMMKVNTAIQRSLEI